MKHERPLVNVLFQALNKRPGVMHVVVGPRQVGKTTAIRQVCGHLDFPSHWASADSPVPPGAEWIESHWRLARTDAARSRKPVLLVLDEIQKVRGWSETVKRLWDETQAGGVPLRVVLLGSSALLVQAGLTESLTGRFFLHRCMHWGWPECRKAFGWDLNDWLYCGGYPGAAAFADDEQAWRQYISDAMVETVLSRDVFQFTHITKPALMRHLFGLAAQFPAQVVSYTKLMGQLQDAGNTTTLAHYLRLLDAAFLVTGLEQYSAGQIRKRGSSPKLVFWNNALIHAMSGRTRRGTFEDGPWLGRIVENAIGAQLLNRLQGAEWSITYWRDGNKEVDFVVRRGARIWGIEVKSGRSGKLSGMEAFRRRYPKAEAWLIGAEGLALETFFAREPETFFE